MPIQLSEENGGTVIAVHVSGKLVKADYEHADAAEARTWLIAMY